MYPKEKMETSTFEVFLYDNYPEYDLVAHYHEFYEVHLVLSGEVSYWVDGNICTMHPGNLILLSPMQLHKPALTDKYSCQRIVLWLDKHYLENVLHQGALRHCFETTRLYNAPQLIEAFQLLLKEYQSNDYAAPLYAECIICQILIELSRQNQKTVLSENAKPMIAEIISYVGIHYTEDLSLNEIAQHFHISKFYLSHLFKTETGTSLYHYILIKRLSLARQLIGSGHPVSQVYSLCGFKDYSVFFKAYKTEYKQAPSVK